MSQSRDESASEDPGRWSAARLAPQIEARLQAPSDPFLEPFTLVAVEVGDSDVVVTFRFGDRDSVFGVAVSAAGAPIGPMTDVECKDAGDWAHEVVILLDEELSTGWVETRPSGIRADGVVMLERRYTGDLSLSPPRRASRWPRLSQAVWFPGMRRFFAVPQDGSALGEPRSRD